MPPIAIDPLIAAAVVVATACTDAECAGDLSTCGLVLHCNNGRAVLYARSGLKLSRMT
jgi:hypothetical protein